jgi:hypothetical protein
LNDLDTGTIRFELNRFAARPSDNLGAIFDLFTLSSVLPSFDVVISLGMKFDLAADADLVAEFTVRFEYG